MMADEIRAWSKSIKKDHTHDCADVQAEMLVEIAAQLAELNETLRAGIKIDLAGNAIGIRGIDS